LCCCGSLSCSGVEPVDPWLDRLLYAPLAAEAALDVEFWSVQKDITITPHDVMIVNQAGVGSSPVQLSALDLAEANGKAGGLQVALEGRCSATVQFRIWIRS